MGPFREVYYHNCTYTYIHIYFFLINNIHNIIYIYMWMHELIYDTESCIHDHKLSLFTIRTPVNDTVLDCVRFMRRQEFYVPSPARVLDAIKA